MKLVDHPDEEWLALTPDRRASNGRFDLWLIESGSLGECGGVNAPFVLASAAGADAIDDDFAIADSNSAGQAKEVSAQGNHRIAERLVAHEDTKQAERFDAGARRHPLAQAGVDGRLKCTRA